MKEIDAKQIKEAVKQLALKACIHVDDDTMSCIAKQYDKEDAEPAKSILKDILSNAEIAISKNIPACQDTGVSIVFLKVGQDVHLTGDIHQAINEGVKEAYIEGKFRLSIVKSPLDRKNTNTNTPCIIHYEIIPGDNLQIIFMPKGAGSENVSSLAMLNPSTDYNDIVNYVIEAMKKVGGKACPPYIVGIGLGGDFETAPLLAKQALLRNINDNNEDPLVSKLENELKEKINQLNIGPMGVGGKETVLAVKVNTYPCHIASCPIAINILCHCNRKEEIIL